MTLQPRKALLLTLSAAAVATGLGVGPASAGAATPQGRPPTLDWGHCADAPADSSRECATLRVPLDYGKPDGRQVDLAVTRIRSDRPEARRGALLVIAGGPGGSGVAEVAGRGKKLMEATQGMYDIVSLDPRGVGGSTKASCGLSDDDRDLTHLRPWPGPGGDITENVARAKRIADACARNGGELLRSISSTNEVRDIERFRQALGEEKLSAVGRSYGTYVGAVYAQKYPERTDRWVLDSNGDPDPSRVERGWSANMSVGADDRFPDFARWAADPARDSGGKKQRLARTPEEVRPLFLALAAKLDREPRKFADGHLLTGDRLRQNLQQALYDDKSFGALADLILAASRDGAAPVEAPELIPVTIPDTEAAVMIGVLCNDVRWPKSLASYAREVAVDRVRHPLTAGMPVGVMPCAFWKDAPADKPTRITSDGPSNVLMIQNLRDPATPYSGALKMREAFGDRARLVSVDSGGHGAYLKWGNACGDRAVSTFLTTGERPGRDVFCKAEG